MTRAAAALALLLVLVVPGRGASQTPSAITTAISSRGVIESAVSRHTLSADQDPWTHIQLRGIFTAGRRNVLSGEVVGEREFGDDGVFFGISNTHTFNDDWYAVTAAGSSAGGFYLPRYRVNGSLSRKWLERRRLVTTVGAGYYAAKDAHRDTALSAGGAYYFTAPLLVEGAVTWNISRPGAVVSRYQFIAFTQGRDRHRYIVVRLAAGNESYQLIAPGSPIADFASRSATLSLRQWVRPAWGVTGSVELYSNPSYRRNAVTVGAFAHF